MKNQRVQGAGVQGAAGRPNETEPDLDGSPEPGEGVAGAHAAPPEEDSRAHWSRLLGLHPLVAFGMIAVDMMLFGGEAATVGVGLMVTIPVAMALAIPCILLQRYSFKDAWGAAIGKGLMVGVLTAIPFPIGSPLTIVGGILGLRGMNRPKHKLLSAPVKTRVLPEPKR